MKKIFKAIVSVLAVSLGVLCFAACGEAKIDEPDPTENEVKVADNTEYLDEITKTLKLTKAYTGKNFYSDGIGEATVAAFTDGDTTLFRLKDTSSPIGSTVNIRYFEIDTPESTGSVEKWGKAASLFVKDRLSQATQIVLEATTTPASKDSYGSRYLGYVWYKTADYDEFKNLNLEIVENGYSEDKGMNTNAYPYYSYFKKANENARAIKLRLYSDLDDPLYSTDPIDTTIKEFNENPLAFYNEEYEVGSKIRFTAYLKSLTIGSTGTYTFVAEEYDKETGKTYTVNMYTGYSSSAASKMKIGHLYQIVGSIQRHNGEYQVAGPVFNDMYPSETNTHSTQKNYYWSFDSSTNYTDNNNVTLYSNVRVLDIKVEGTVMTIKGSAQKNTRNGYAEESTEFTFEVNVEEGYTPSLSAGDRFAAHAYRFDADKDTLTILDVADIVNK